jgi:hypothetical protein
VKNLKLFFLAALAVGCFSMIGCSKNSSSSTPAASADSVLYTNWTPLSMNGNVDNTNDTFFTQTIAAKAITQHVLNTGIIIGYVQGVDNNGDTLIVNASTLMTENFYVGSIYLESDPFQIGTAGINYSGFNYRYVVIPGRIATTGVGNSEQTFTPAQLRSMSYSTVTKIFNIPTANGGVQGSAKIFTPR